MSGKDESDGPSDLARSARPFWQEDRVWPQCGEAGCGLRFGTFARKHHCRACGYIFCHEHCSHKLPIPEMGYPVPVRVCIACFEKRRSKGLMGMQTNFKT